MKKITHNYGLKVPRNVAHTYELDKRYNNTLWAYTIKEEMKNVIVAFDIKEKYRTIYPENSYLDCYLIFMLKLISLGRLGFFQMAIPLQ